MPVAAHHTDRPAINKNYLGQRALAEFALQDAAPAKGKSPGRRLLDKANSKMRRKLIAEHRSYPTKLRQGRPGLGNDPIKV